MSDEDLEVPGTDAIEQQQDAAPGGEPGLATDVPLEADEADVAEQAAEIAADDDDDYR